MTLETTTTEAPAPIGHNAGPSETYELIDRILRRTDEIEKGASEYLTIENPDLMRRLKEIRATLAAGVPSKINSKAEAEKLSDLRNAVKKWLAAAKLARTGSKKPWSSIADSFYAFFTRPMDELGKIDADKLEPVLQDWQSREADRQKREEEAKAAAAREEAERQIREAAEAETRRLEAEQKERDAREAAERADRERLAAIKASEDAKRAREEEERRAVEARERAMREEAERKERQEAAAKEEENRRQANSIGDIMRGIARIVEKADIEKRREELRKIESEQKEQARKLAEQKRNAERQAIAARKDIRAETRNESEAIDAATRAERAADKSEAIAESKPAALSRVRGEHGSVSSLRTFLNFRDLNRAELDLEALRYHLPLAALETAVRSYIDVGGTKLRGVEIFEDQSTVTR